MELQKELYSELADRIIPFWKGMRDTENGGYYGEMNADLQMNKQADKGCILHSRILWFFSSAYLLLGEKALLEHARHACRFLLDCCLDREYGGVYWSVTYGGKPADSTKHTYSQAFAVYALSAYYRASREQRALDVALDLFARIEETCADAGGYREAFTRDWVSTANEKLSENGVTADRTMNTLLHIFEAYSGLYEAHPSEDVADGMRRILQLFVEKVYNPQRRRLEVFFDCDFQPLLDLHSYGHDIEAAWLLDWGSSLLRDSELARRVSAVTDALAQEVYARAYHGGALYNECENGMNDQTKVWWVQAEAMVGFLNHYQKHREQSAYLQAVSGLWETVKAELVDFRPGSEWFWETDVDGVPNGRKTIAGMWKGPYHNGRMCMEMIRRLTHAAS